MHKLKMLNFKIINLSVGLGVVAIAWIVFSTFLSYSTRENADSDSDLVYYNCAHKLSRLNCRIQMSDPEIKAAAAYKNDKNEIFIEGFGWVNMYRYISLMNDINICLTIKEDCTKKSTDIFCRLAYYHFGATESK